MLTGVMMLALAGCGLRYVGTEDQMQQVARGTAEMLKKNPYGDMVSGAGTAAHMALSMTMGQSQQAEEKRDISGQPCVQMFTGCYVSQDRPADGDKYSMESFTGLPNNFYKNTSIGKD
ncbi:Hypothetical protein H16_B1308 [Cupriavidus necator H16]|nr:Hypothetical protein H16_B1308 [Cupriavidus necator H16]